MTYSSPASTVTASFPLQLYLRFVSVFTKDYFCCWFFFSFLLRRTNCWSGGRGSPAGPWQMSSGKEVPRVQDSVGSALPRFWRPSLPRLEVSVFIAWCVYPWQACHSPASVQFPLCHKEGRWRNGTHSHNLEWQQQCTFFLNVVILQKLKSFIYLYAL